MSLVIPPLLRKPQNPAEVIDALAGQVRPPQGPSRLETLGRPFGYSRGADRPTTNDAAAVSGLRSRQNVVGAMLEDPGADRRAAQGLTPTSRQSAQEDEYLQAQVAPAEAADQRRRAAIAEEAALIAQRQKLAQGEAMRRFEEKYGVPYDPVSEKFVLDSEKLDEADDDYYQAEKVLKSYVASGMDPYGKPYRPEDYEKDLKQLAIRRGLRVGANAGYFNAVAPPKNQFVIPQ